MLNTKVLLVYLILSIPIILMAQDELTILKASIEKATGKEKIDLLNDLSIIARKTNRYESINYSRQAFKLALDERYMLGEALAKKNEGICWFFIGNNDSAAICYSHALKLFSEVNDMKGISACYNNLGLIAQETGKYDDAIKFYNKSINIDRKLGDEIGMALTMENIADIWLYKGNAKKAFLLTNECLQIYNKLFYKPGLMASYSNRGSEYDYLKQFEKAIQDFNTSSLYARELKDVYQEIKNISNIGIVYWHWGKPEIALRCLYFALEVSDESDDAYNIDNTLKTIAEIYTYQKHYIEANEILMKVLKRNEELENKRQAAVTMTLIGRNLIELNEIDKAIGYLTKSLDITRELNAPYEMIENYRNLAYAYAILHDFKTADSLQNLFAETYSTITHSDSTLDLNENKLSNNKVSLTSGSKSSNWIIASALFAILIVLSIIAFPRK